MTESRKVTCLNCDGEGNIYSIPYCHTRTVCKDENYLINCEDCKQSYCDSEECSECDGTGMKDAESE
ncbi:hypothetical protein GW931_03755 [archaeon]|nr:hypothetical protein [archaeon]PJC45693.1 MAG: hypothetical protein CO037_00175 [Candidatus Pacearchaeota archaeon CG_4_9_14_0_2_um_filter_30_8]